MEEKYTLDYFIDFYKDIPAEWFTFSTDKEQQDAYEWLPEIEQEALFKIVKPWGYLTDCNDGVDGYDLYGDTIKERIVNFLTHIKQNRLPYLHY